MPTRARGAIIAILGIWFIIAGLSRFSRIGEMWSDFLTGVFVVVVGFSLLRPQPVNAFAATVVGAWMVVSAFMPGFHSGAGLLVNNIGVGLGAFLIGVAVYRRRNRRPPRARAA
jgi:peptidoglycan/LPS O-acetylase OafA/YrhL